MSYLSFDVSDKASTSRVTVSPVPREALGRVVSGGPGGVTWEGLLETDDSGVVVVDILGSSLERGNVEEDCGCSRIRNGIQVRC